MTPKEHLLVILAEECVETAQRVSKALRFGLYEIQPAQELTNVERIVLEYSHMCAAMDMLMIGLHASNADKKTVHALIADKKLQIRKFLKYSKECGTLQ